MAQGGFGMCGHKNSYSSNVRYGNWNEDRYGAEILSKRDVPPLKYETEYTSNHKDPKTVSIDPKVLSVKLESLDELRAKNKDGLTYGLIFQHGHTDELPQERFSTTLQQANERFKSYAVPDHTLAARREKLLSREMLEITSMTTESRKASMRLNTPGTSRIDSGTKLVDILQPEPLPRWNRRNNSKI